VSPARDRPRGPTVDALSDPADCIVTMAITEGGYPHDPHTSAKQRGPDAK